MLFKNVYESEIGEVFDPKLVIFTVVAIGLAIAIIDTTCSFLINTVAGLIG